MRILRLSWLLAAALLATPAAADQYQSLGGYAPGSVPECINSQGLAVPCPLSDTSIDATTVTKPFTAPTAADRARVVAISPNSGAGQYPTGAIPITGNGTGTTGAVVGTLTGLAGKTTYICGFDVSALGGTAAIGPITIAGLKGSSMVYQLSSLAAGITLSRTFSPCIPASAAGTPITTTTTTDGTASVVDVNSWGFQQ